MAEALSSLYKAELIGSKGPWTSIDDVEVATAEWVHWYNTVRPHSAIGMLTPVEHEHAHHAATGADATALEVVDRPLPQTTTTR
ncbi:integrase core domain-containing protein [Actinomyces haliotis]